MRQDSAQKPSDSTPRPKKKQKAMEVVRFIFFRFFQRSPPKSQKVPPPNRVRLVILRLNLAILPPSWRQLGPPWRLLRPSWLHLGLPGDVQNWPRRFQDQHCPQDRPRPLPVPLQTLIFKGLGLNFSVLGRLGLLRQKPYRRSETRRRGWQ